MSPASRQVRHSERGGVAMLMALMLMVMLAAAALGASSNVLRELSLGGDALQGALALEAADSGVAWFLAGAWSQGPEPSWCPDGRFELPGAAGALPSRPGFRQGFDLRGVDLGPWPGPDRVAYLGPHRLWQVTVRGWCRAEGVGERLAFQSLDELLVAVPALGAAAQACDPAGAASQADDGAGHSPDSADPLQPLPPAPSGPQSPRPGLVVLACRTIF